MHPTVTASIPLPASSGPSGFPGRRVAASNLRLLVLFVIDLACWLIAGGTALALDRDGTSMGEHSLLGFLLVAGPVQAAAGLGAGLYRRRFIRGSTAEFRVLLAVVVGVGVLASTPLVDLVTSWVAPGADWHWSLAVVATPLAFVLMGATRYLWRVVVTARRRPDVGARRALLVGAGEAADLLIPQLQADRRSPIIPVGILDDDPARRRLRVHGVPVLGDRSALADAAAATGAAVVVVAVARADAALLRDIRDRATEAGLGVLVLPPLDEVLQHGARPRDLRDVSIDDLIGRRPIDTDPGRVAGYLTGRRVLVTGAGGSIGSELCRQISRLDPAELILLDRDETALQGVQVSISGHGLLDTTDVVLADIRDAAALHEIMADRRPDVVFHAAALKHLPMLEQYPGEAWQTNVMGTLNVLDACESAGVETVVNISTDKAAAPTSVLGRSKRLAERLTADRARRTGRRYLSVRFGNVLGSRGSMVPLFSALIAAGRPLTVTHPDATRFFMTIPEACQLVIQAGAIGDPAEVLILDMGEPVRILDVAQRMIAMSGSDVDIVFTGLRPGEKLHEELMSVDETDARPVHPLISHTAVPPLSPCDLDATSLVPDSGIGAPRPLSTAG
ncbi:polysaccharide biosynthesis protein [Frigoribacterium sp. 2-23]|uniref:polysaccharide biosynthesis protein n=1 Tax=Frigoribacterium sp. 2-23 TaxID=3415006 RepID=UPI003C6F93E8